MYFRKHLVERVGKNLSTCTQGELFYFILGSAALQFKLEDKVLHGIVRFERILFQLAKRETRSIFLRVLSILQARNIDLKNIRYYKTRQDILQYVVEHDEHELVPIVLPLVNVNDNKCNGKKSALSHSVYNVKVMEQLLAAGANVHAKDKKTRTPLYFAVVNGNLETAQLLLKHGAILTPCMFSSANQATASLFSETKFTRGQWSSVVLHTLRHCRSETTLKRILEYRSDYYVSPKEALYTHASNGEFADYVVHYWKINASLLQQVVPRLMKCDSFFEFAKLVPDFNELQYDSKCRNPLYYAIEYGNDRVAQDLIHKHGANINATKCICGPQLLSMWANLFKHTMVDMLFPYDPKYKPLHHDILLYNAMGTPWRYARVTSIQELHSLIQNVAKVRNFQLLKRYWNTEVEELDYFSKIIVSPILLRSNYKTDVKFAFFI